MYSHIFEYRVIHYDLVDHYVSFSATVEATCLHMCVCVCQMYDRVIEEKKESQIVASMTDCISTPDRWSESESCNP